MAELRTARSRIYHQARWWLVAVLAIIGLVVAVTRWHGGSTDTVGSRSKLAQELAHCFDSAERIDVQYASSDLVLSASNGDAAFQAVRREVLAAVTDGDVVGVDREPEALLYLIKRDGTRCAALSLYAWYIGFKGERFKVDALPQDIVDLSRSN